MRKDTFTTITKLKEELASTKVEKDEELARLSLE